MHHLRGWVLVPALKTLHQLIAELQRANNVWATAFENDRQADRTLNVSVETRCGLRACLQL